MSQDVEPQKLKGRTLGLVAVIMGLPIFLLSGMCTAAFVVDAASGGPDAYSPGIWGALIIGAFGYVPAGLLAWAGWRLRKHGKNRVSTGILVLLGFYIIAILLFISTLGF